jgi:hypothetical protein
MYFPILRGKQYELIALRELAEILPKGRFCPVIEPVRNNMAPLYKTIKVLNENEIVPLVIINPKVGDFSNSGDRLLEAMRDTSEIDFIPCVRIEDGADGDSIALYQEIGAGVAAFVAGGVDKGLVEALAGAHCVFINNKIPISTQRKFKNVVVYGDHFNKQIRNADYEERSFYSSMHVEYLELKHAIGFGDYTILSEEYVESGGPAYVVAIHLSYIDEEEFDAMYVLHFSSYDDGSPANPGGKFMDALAKLIGYVDGNADDFALTQGLTELRATHEAGHFPGLGVVKKMSMMHHIETICLFVEEQ